MTKVKYPYNEKDYGKKTPELESWLTKKGTIDKNTQAAGKKQFTAFIKEVRATKFVSEDKENEQNIKVKKDDANEIKKENIGKIADLVRKHLVKEILGDKEAKKDKIAALDKEILEIATKIYDRVDKDLLVNQKTTYNNFKNFDLKWKLCAVATFTSAAVLIAGMIAAFAVPTVTAGLAVAAIGKVGMISGLTFRGATITPKQLEIFAGAVVSAATTVCAVAAKKFHDKAKPHSQELKSIENNIIDVFTEVANELSKNIKMGNNLVAMNQIQLNEMSKLKIYDSADHKKAIKSKNLQDQNFEDFEKKGGFKDKISIQSKIKAVAGYAKTQAASKV